jgi:hypothetical protein
MNRRQPTIPLLVLALFLGLAAHAEPGGRFKRLVETTSPDGKWVLGWGQRDNPDAPLGSFKEIPRDEKALDIDADVENYLIDAPSGRILAVIPEFGYFAGSEGRQNRHSLTVAWSPDGRGALAIYDGRYSFESITWFDPTARKFGSLGDQFDASLDRAVSAVASKKAALRAANHQIFQPIILEPGILVVLGGANSYSNKSDPGPDFTFRFKFKITGSGEKVRLQLLKWKQIEDREEPYIEDGKVEPTLNEVYSRLRAKLNAAGKEALKSEELRWLKVRGALPENHRLDYTRQRIAELRARAVDW